MMRGSLAWNWRTDILCFLLFFLFVSFAQFSDKLNQLLTQVEWRRVIVFLFLSCSAFFLITLNGSVDYTHFKTCAYAFLKLNPCDWGRETFLWHVTKICPGEWVIKGFWEGTVSKNEYQHERTQSRQRFSGSPCPGSYSQRQRFKHCFAWLYLWNDAFIWTNRIYLGYEKYIPGLCQKCYSGCHVHLVVECYIMRHHVSLHTIQISSNAEKYYFLAWSVNQWQTHSLKQWINLNVFISMDSLACLSAPILHFFTPTVQKTVM